MIKKERNKYYRRALEDLQEDWRIFSRTKGVCTYLRRASDYDLAAAEFPEFTAKAPRHVKKRVESGLDTITSCLWFSRYTKYGYHQRVRILEECIKETEE